jgi:pimeloyl-ACP methyl ester carboxylesterase
MAAPLPFLLTWVTGLISVAMLATGGWLLVQWRESGLVEDAFLVAALALLAVSLFGRLPVRLLLGRGPSIPDLPRGEREIVTGSGGAALHVEAYGPKDGQPVVLTHGWGLDRTIWSGVIQALSPTKRVILWDLPGLGCSGRPLDGDYSLERLAADLDSVLQLAAGGRPAVLVGHSIGGMTMLTWARRPSSAAAASGMVLVNTTPIMPIETSKGFALLERLREPVLKPLLRLTIWAEPFVRVMNWASYLNGSMHLVARITAFGDAPGADAVEHVARLNARNAPGVQAKGMLAMLDWTADGEPRRLAMPIRIISGERDLLTCPVASRYMADVAPDATLIEVEGAGHMGLLERPEVYDEAIVRFVEQIEDRVTLMERPRSYDVISPSTSLSPPRLREPSRANDEDEERPAPPRAARAH